MLFKKLYYYYHHYKMWSYIVRQLKVQSDAKVLQLKRNYMKKNKCKHSCYLCDYDEFIKTSSDALCFHCPLYKKYGEDCLPEDSLYHKIVEPAMFNMSFEERVAAAEKVRDCVLPWKGKSDDRRN